MVEKSVKVKSDYTYYNGGSEVLKRKIKHILKGWFL